MSLAYLWRQPQAQLLRDMWQAGIHAVMVKVAAIGHYRPFTLIISDTACPVRGTQPTGVIIFVVTCASVASCSERT